MCVCVGDRLEGPPHPELQWMPGLVGRMFIGVEGLAQAFLSQCTLHNWKGGMSRACGVVGRILPSHDACAVHRYKCAISPRYKLGDVPQDNNTATSCNTDFARGFPLLAVKRGSLQHYWHKTAFSGSLLIFFVCLFPMW